MKTNAKKNAVVGFVCAFALASGGASLAHAQGGGTVAPTGGPAPAPGASAGSWTVYKKATWYGPGLWGNKTACGMKLSPKVVGTAHRKLPCGTQVTFTHKGRAVTATVIDRGPFRKGYAWDLTKKTAKRLNFLPVGSGKIKATVTPTR